jgi:hypothetical protein
MPLVQVANDGTTVVVLMRIVGVDQTLIEQASVSSISRRVMNTSVTPATTIEEEGALEPADTVFDDPKFDYGWTDSNDGYNFRDMFVASECEMTAVYTFLDISDPPNPIVEKVVIQGGFVP